MVKAKKVAYFAHLEECLNKYPRAFLVDADFVGSKQISDIRIALRGKVTAAHSPCYCCLCYKEGRLLSMTAACKKMRSRKPLHCPPFTAALRRSLSSARTP